MSLERACVNCERCYELANELIAIKNTRVEGDLNDDYIDYADKILIDKYRKDTKDWNADKWHDIKGKIKLSIMKNPAFRKKQVYENDQVYAVRNEAMKALENVVDISTTWARYRTVEGDIMDYYGARTGGPTAEEALKTCQSCDYSAPKIVQTVENLSKLKE